MSGDVQPRKRKDKRRKKEDLPGNEDVGSSTFSSDETIHVHKDTGTGGNICAKVVFFLLLGALAVMVGLILTEYRGSSDVDTPVAESRWAQVFDGLVDERLLKHGEHDQLTEESGEHEEEHSEEVEEPGDDEHDEHGEEEEEEEVEEVDSEEVQSPEQEEDGQASDESEEGQQEEEEEEDDDDDDDEEEEEELEISEEELRDIPGVMESDEDEEEDDVSAGAEEDIDDDVSEEARGEDDEAEGEDGGGGDDDNEAVEEVGGEETEGDKEVGHDDKAGDNDGSEEEPSGATRAADISPEESETEEEESEEEEVLPARRATKASGGQAYGKADITSKDDLKISEHLDLADAELGEKPEEALSAFLAILMTNPTSPRARYGKAQALDQLAEQKHSNSLLQEAIDAYESVLALGSSVPDKLYVKAADRCINRMRFKGQYHTAIHIHKKLIQRFSDEAAHPNQLAVTYLMINRLTDAKRVLEDTLRRWPDNGFAQVHYGFILKTGDDNNEAAVDYLTRGIATREPGTIDGRFFFHLGDALTRLGRHEEAGKVYELGVKEGLFLSKYQRSLYNVDRLRAQPWWTPEETTYSKYFKKLQDNWRHIREEALAVLANKVFKDEAENLRDIGKWQQFELYARGTKITTNCEKAPYTCQLISEFPAARDCRRGQAKFSVMHAGTHVWPHCGPTNCRLRSHLGLIVPQGTYIRVAEETRTWEEGKLFIFDDSFEHEVWHNGTTTRLVLIVDVWHPELTEAEKKLMPAI